MGGVINQDAHANAPLMVKKKWAEFNIMFDPKASKGVFDICAKHNIKILLSPLDLTLTLTFSAREVKRLENIGNPVAKIMAALIERVPDWYLAKFGTENPRQPAHDVHATMCLYHPELYVGRAVSIAVDGNDKKTKGSMHLTKDGPENIFMLQLPAKRKEKFYHLYEQDMKTYDATYSLTPHE